MDNFEQDFAKSVKLDAAPPAPVKPSSNIYIYILLGLIIAALSVALILSQIRISELESGSTNIEALLEDAEASPTDVIVELGFILEKEGVDEYIRQFQKVIDSADDSELKAEYLIARAAGLFDYDLSEDNNYSHRNQILADAKEAERIAPSISSAAALYDYSDVFGDEESASYYEDLFTQRIESYNNAND